MLDQTFSARSLFRLLKASDTVNFSLGASKEEQLITLDHASSKINDDNFQFSDFETFKRNGTFVFKAKGIHDEMALRKINSNLKKIYKVKQTDRQTVVNQIQVLLQDGSPFHIVKLDIKSFYESLKRKKILLHTWSDPIISYRTKFLVERLLTCQQFEKIHGLPRGISVSSTLSEQYLQNFDQLIKEIPGVYYSARYVDDIIIFCISDPNLVYQEAKLYLKGLHLDLNLEKSRTYSNLNRKIDTEIDYLGYRFKKNSERVYVTIAPKKIKKIKTRIVQAFLDHLRLPNFDLLSLRLKFLTGNHPLDSRSKITGSPLKSGIYYNYSQIARDSQELVDLDQFLLKLIYSKSGTLGTRVAQSLSSSQKRHLRKFSFTYGFRERISHSFTFTETKLIRKCWNNG